MIKIASSLLLLFFFSLLTACGEVPIARPETPKAISTPSSTEETIKATTITTKAQPTPSLEARITPISTEQPKITPSPTPKPLSPLDKNAQVIVFTVASKKGPQIYRVQMDEQGRKVGPMEQVDFPLNPRIHISGLFPSPDSKSVAVGWTYGDGGASFIHILNVTNGKLSSLFQKDKEYPAIFLDWSPDSQSILIMGVLGSDLGDSAWLVDINTHIYYDVNIKTKRGLPLVSSASFSPDGQTIVYAQSDCSQCGSQIWRTTLNQPNRQLLYEDSEASVTDVLWSPDGSHIAFTKWSEPDEWVEFAMGELWIMSDDGSDKYLLSPIINHYYGQFRPAWSANGRQIAFIGGDGLQSGSQLNELSSNLYVADISDKQVNQLTHFQDAQIIKPSWSPDGSKITFLAHLDKEKAEFTPLTVATTKSPKPQNLIVQDLPESQSSIINNLDRQSFIVWLPEESASGERK